MKKKVLWVLVSLAAVAVIVWAFFFPIQRMVTEKEYTPPYKYLCKHPEVE